MSTMRPEENRTRSGPSPTRRDFLGQVAGAAAGLATIEAATSRKAAAGNTAGSADERLLPTIQLGSYRITRLILGGNPIYGHSHFNRLYSQHLIDYHTPERVVELLGACAANGLNAWQNSYTERTAEDVRKCREAGLDFHWLLLGKTNWLDQPGMVARAAQLGPIGIAPHGALAERLHREGRIETLKDQLKQARDAGVLVGLSAHNPAVIELAEEQDWDVDYYMCCCYYLTRPRDEFAAILGQVPMGEVYLENDRERMLDVVAAARKPCLVYKVFAAGRADLSPRGVRSRFQETLARIKPTDAMIVGMFQEFGDQVGQNASLVRELSAPGA
jgi:hypothetical protein